MSSGGGKSPSVVNYDPSTPKASMQARATELKDQTVIRAFESQLNAENYAKQNLGLLNEGLGFLSNYLETQRQATQNDLQTSENLVNLVPSYSDKAQAGAKFTTDTLLSYLKQAEDASKGGYK